MELQTDVDFGDSNSPEKYNKRAINTVNEQALKLVKQHVRIRVLEKALGDLLNDCINFNGADLTEWCMKQASDALKDDD